MKKLGLDNIADTAARETFGSRLGQIVLEYALLVAVVAAAFIAMSFYIKRAVQGTITSIEEQGILSKAGRLSSYYEPPQVPV